MHDEPVRRSLVQVRWLLIVLESLVALGFLWAGDPEHRPLGLLAVCAALGAVDAVRLAWQPRLLTHPLAHVAIDLGALAMLSVLWGPHHPLQALALVEMTIVATVLPARLAWPVTGLAIGLQVLDAALQARGGEDALHLVSHVAIGAVAAISLTWFSQLVGRALRAREAARLQAESEKERAARLAVVGTLAAGVAHELATPLGSIALLAEEVEADAPAHPALAEIQNQVRRSRGILDRLLDRGDAPLVSCPAFGARLATWIDEWRAANPDSEATLSMTDEVPAAVVRGDGDSWRGGLWTLLDNARQAGGPSSAIGVEARCDAGTLVVDVVDRGPGPTSEAVLRAGEPFFSDWPDGAGTGLGLYALRNTLERVGGAFALSARDGGGATARIWVPLATQPSP
jgi:two-component system sensor histidine kinase RegB